MSLFKNENYQLSLSIGPNSSQLPAIICVFDNNAAPNVIRAYVLGPSPLNDVYHRDMPDIHSISDTKLKISGASNLPFQAGQSRGHVKLIVISELVAAVLLGTTYIDMFIMWICPSERKIFQYRSTPVFKSTVQDTESGAETDRAQYRQEFTEYMPQLVTPTNCDRWYVVNVRQVVL